MNGYARALIQVSEAYLRRDCRETSENRGVCVDEIHRLYGDRIPLNEAWCAKFCYVTHVQACMRTLSNVLLPKTKGALDMGNKAERKGFTVDRIPRVGDVMLRRTGKGWHVGNVIAVADRLYTIEGNTSNRVGLRWYSFGDVAKPANDFRFIHVAEQYPDSIIALARLEWY